MCFICTTGVAGVLTLKSRRTPNPSSNFICISHNVMKLEEAKKKRGRTGFNLIRMLVEYKSHQCSGLMLMTI